MEVEGGLARRRPRGRAGEGEEDTEMQQPVQTRRGRARVCAEGGRGKFSA